MTKKLLIIGGGPAGLSAAINAASEGIAVTIFDRADGLGGQFKESNAIENYPGFAKVTGSELSQRMIEQAQKFNVDFQCPVSIGKIERKDGKIILTSDDWRTFEGDAAVVALGLQWRRLEATGIDAMMGRGVSYGAPSYHVADDATVAIVGGGNSAGQQAVKMASSSSRTVYMVVRKTLADQMSQYLIDQIVACSNIEVIESNEVTAIFANEGKLAQIMLSSGRSLRIDELMIFIGATPHTFWLGSTGIELDKGRYIITGSTEQSGCPYETTIPGVFAIGDARSGSCKRIGAAVGEGSTLVPYVHKFLAAQTAG
jgi:thioredoxin reductase (NADPH)